MMEYYLSKQTTMDFDEAVEKVTSELQKEGFGVITSIDVKHTFKNKLDMDFRPYTILGACNPVYAHRAIELDDKIGTLLPCNFMIQQTEKGAEISAMNPQVTMNSLLGPELEEIGRTITGKIKAVLANL
jgi:uncharacterized protein (DUF302 family)